MNSQLFLKGDAPPRRWPILLRYTPYFDDTHGICCVKNCRGSRNVLGSQTFYRASMRRNWGRSSKRFTLIRRWKVPGSLWDMSRRLCWPGAYQSRTTLSEPPEMSSWGEDNTRRLLTKSVCASVDERSSPVWMVLEDPHTTIKHITYLGVPELDGLFPFHQTKKIENDWTESYFIPGSCYQNTFIAWSWFLITKCKSRQRTSMSIKNLKCFACLTTQRGSTWYGERLLTSRSIFRASAVFSAIQAWLPRIWIPNAFPESCIGDPKVFVISAFFLRAW